MSMFDNYRPYNFDTMPDEERVKLLGRAILDIGTSDIRELSIITSIKKVYKTSNSWVWTINDKPVEYMCKWCQFVDTSELVGQRRE